MGKLLDSSQSIQTSKSKLFSVLIPFAVSRRVQSGQTCKYPYQTLPVLYSAVMVLHHRQPICTPKHRKTDIDTMLWLSQLYATVSRFFINLQTQAPVIQLLLTISTKYKVVHTTGQMQTATFTHFQKVGYQGCQIVSTGICKWITIYYQANRMLIQSPAQSDSLPIDFLSSL